MNAINPSPAAIQPATPYTLPNEHLHADWYRLNLPGNFPSERQQQVIAAVRRALEEGLFYTDAVLARCLVLLNVSPEVAAIGQKENVGGRVGMDCYYARQYIREQDRQALLRVRRDQLKPHVGQQLGTLVFNNDFKRNTGVVIEQVLDEGCSVAIRGRRGSTWITANCDVLSIQYAMDRAMERGLRKQGFEAFTGQTGRTSSEATTATA